MAASCLGGQQTMNHPLVYELSMKYGPPRIDLRKAWIMDSHGDDTFAGEPLHHRVPEDVSRQHLDRYQAVYAFMEFADLLFYLYPIAAELERDPSLFCIESFIWSLNGHVPTESASLPAEDQRAFLDGLKWLWDSAPPGSPDFPDWYHCPNLQAAIGVSVTWKDFAGDTEGHPE